EDLGKEIDVLLRAAGAQRDVVNALHKALHGTLQSNAAVRPKAGIHAVRLKPGSVPVRLKPESVPVRLKPGSVPVRLKPDSTICAHQRGALDHRGKLRE